MGVDMTWHIIHQKLVPQDDKFPLGEGGVIFGQDIVRASCVSLQW